MIIPLKGSEKRLHLFTSFFAEPIVFLCFGGREGRRVRRALGLGLGDRKTGVFKNAAKKKRRKTQNKKRGENEYS